MGCYLAGTEVPFRPLSYTNFLNKFSKLASKMNPNTRAKVRRFAEKFRRLYEQGARSMRLWRYAQRWWRWHRAGLDGRVVLKGGLKRVVIRQLRMLGIVGFPIPTYDAQTGTWQMRKSSASG